MENIAKARAHVNIAFVKYWGKEDQDLIIPMNSSLSLTLSELYTETSVLFSNDLATDEVFFNGTLIQDKMSEKMLRFIDLIRVQAGIEKQCVKIETQNFVPTAAGLASSASGFAALAAAGAKAAGLDLSRQDLSRLARRGSGSATRSIFGGFTAWQKGNSDATSYAVPIQEDVEMDIAVIVAVVSAAEKKVTSRMGMQHTVDTSPFYPSWVKVAERDFIDMQVAIKEQDLEKIGKIAESNALKMHATTFASEPPFMYFAPETIAMIQATKSLREQGYLCYNTIDAGPNVKMVCKQSEAQAIIQKLQIQFPTMQFITCTPGPGIQYL